MDKLKPYSQTCNQLATDCISRQVAIDVLHGYFDGMLDTDTVCPADIYALFECISFTEPERKVGKWVYNSPVTMRCSECGLVIADWDWNGFKFCPNCGLKMRGGEGDD